MILEVIKSSGICYSNACVSNES